jgi:hypothetical protein
MITLKNSLVVYLRIFKVENNEVVYALGEKRYEKKIDTILLKPNSEMDIWFKGYFFEHDCLLDMLFFMSV